MADKKQDWIDDVELEDIRIKWAFSHFDGREDTFNAKGDYNFQIILDEDVAMKLRDIGWNVRTMDGYEEGDPPEHLLKVKISYRFEPPKIYLIKGERKIRADERDLADIRRDTCERIDVIITPSRWVVGANSGISAYAKELYAVVKESRFSARYADYEEI
jgi:hypothetical protein